MGGAEGEVPPGPWTRTLFLISRQHLKKKSPSKPASPYSVVLIIRLTPLLILILILCVLVLVLVLVLCAPFILTI